LNSVGKIKGKEAKFAIEKLNLDMVALGKRFGGEDDGKPPRRYMTDRAMKTSIEVLEDFTSFFECTPGFISMPCEKLRLRFGKANFTIKRVKQLLDLRQD